METAMTTMATQLATDFVIPTIHLGSFKSYRLPADRPATANNNDSQSPSNIYLQQLQHGSSNIPLRSASAPYPNMQNASSHKLYVTKHPPLGIPPSNATAAVSNPNSSNPVAASPPGMLPSPAAQVSTVSVQPINSPPQTLGPPRELCLECMMRDEDMVDVDVTSPGVWDRESDVWYHELCRREEEEERERNLHPSTSSGISSSASCSRPRARGTKLTEGNLVVWLNLNPSEPTSKQQTLFAYIDSQKAILAAENKARIQALQEARQLDEKMRESCHDLCRSPYDFVSQDSSYTGNNSNKARSPSTLALDDPKNGIGRRDTSLSESPATDSKSRKSRKASRDSLSHVDSNRERDAAYFYDLNGVEGGNDGSGGGGPSTRHRTVYGSATSVPIPSSNTSVIRNVQSMYMPNTSSSWQQQSSTSAARPASMAPDVLPGFSSQTSLASASPSPRKRLFGLRQWSGYFGSNVSLAQSGSMMDMHLGLDQDKHIVHTPHVDIGSKPPSLQDGTPWPHIDARQSPDHATDGTDGPKKKRGLVKLWRMLSGGSVKSNEPVSQSHRYDLDEEPLAPPPPLSYLVNRGSMQSERSLSIVNNNRHASMPSLSFSNASHPTHPITTPTSQPSKTPSAKGQMANLSSPSDQSSTLPSPTDIRFPYRDGSPDVVGIGDDEFTDAKRRMDVSPARVRSLSQNVPTLVANTGSPNFMSISPPTSHGMIRSFSVDKNLPPLPAGEEPDIFAVPTSVSTTTPVNSSTAPNSIVVPSTIIRNPTPSRAAFPLVSPPLPPPPPLQHQQQSYLGESPSLSPGFRYEEPFRRQSFNGLISRPNLPVGAGRASIPGLRQYAYDEFGNPIMFTGSRHSLAVGPVTGVRTLPNGTKRKNKLGLGSIFGRK